MNLKTIADIQSINAEMDAAIQKSMAGTTDDDLLLAASTLVDYPAEALAAHYRVRPNDTPAMIAIHYYRELLRRIEVAAMNDEPRTTEP